MKLFNWIMIVMYIALSCSGLSLMKAGGQSDSGISVFGITLSYKMILGMLCYGISFLIYTFVISRAQISIMIPLLGAVNSCIIILIGILAFHEALNLGQAIGISMVIAGAVVIGLFSKG